MGSHRRKDDAAYKLESEVFFDRIFDRKHGNSAGLHKYILEKFPVGNGKKILDAGCGDGRFLGRVGEADAGNQLFGLDISKNMIRSAREKGIEGCTFQVGDSEALPYDDSTFDLIFCLNSFHHYPSPGRVAEEFYRVLKPGGRTVIGEVYVLPGIRQVINLLLPLTKTGDYRMYSRASLGRIMEDASFKGGEYNLVSPFLFVSVYIKE